MIYLIIGFISLIAFYIAIIKNRDFRGKVLRAFDDDLLPDFINTFMFLIANAFIVIAWPIAILCFGIFLFFNYLKKLD